MKVRTLKQTNMLLYKLIKHTVNLTLLALFFFLRIDKFSNEYFFLEKLSQGNWFKFRIAFRVIRLPF